MSKIIKNTTLADILINDTGVTVLANSSYTVQVQDYLLWAASTDIITLIDSGNIVINNGTSDLPGTVGKSYIQYPDQAQSIKFNNTTNGFSATNVQSAIEEAKMTAGGSGFSWKYIPQGTTVQIPMNMEMNVRQKITVKGQLIVQGELVIL